MHWMFVSNCKSLPSQCYNLWIQSLVDVARYKLEWAERCVNSYQLYSTHTPFPRQLQRWQVLYLARKQRSWRDSGVQFHSGEKRGLGRASEIWGGHMEECSGAKSWNVGKRLNNEKWEEASSDQWNNSYSAWNGTARVFVRYTCVYKPRAVIADHL